MQACKHCNYELEDLYIRTNMGVFCEVCFQDMLWDYVELRAVQKYVARKETDCCTGGNILADGRLYCITCLTEAIQKGKIFLSIKREGKR